MRLVRYAYFDDRTLGQLQYQDQRWWTIECPWLDNTPNVSCIPEGSYELVRVDSPRFGENMWQVSGVPGRTHILVHVANTSADVIGCIGLGTGVYSDLQGVSSSRIAIDAFYDLTAAEIFHTIEIVKGVIE